VNPRIAVIGVRNSWLTFVKKRDFASLLRSSDALVSASTLVITVRATFRKIFALMSVLSALYESGPIGGGYWATGIEEAAMMNANTTAD
jgi:hypothetical protein